MERVDLQPAFILHRRPYRNSSLLLELFTREHGRIGLVARGSARKSQAGLFTPFQPLLVSWQRKGELGTMTTCEAGEGYRLLSGKALMTVLYINELLLRLLPRDAPEPEVFDLYRWAVDSIAAEPGGLERSLRLFEMQLLEWLGYALMLGADSEGREILAGARYIFNAEAGLMRVRSATVGEKSVSGRSMLNLSARRLDDVETLDDAKHVLRLALSGQLGDKGLKIRDCFSKDY